MVEGANPPLARWGKSMIMCLDGTIPVTELPFVLRRIGELSQEFGLDVGNVFTQGTAI